MKYLPLTLALLACSLAQAAGPTSYQLTGSVVELRDNVIVLQKNDEKWEIARDKETKGGGDVKVGDKVTVQYTMRAESILKR